MSARLCDNVCFRCGQPVYVGRYESGSSLCEDCRREVEADALALLGDAEEVKEEQQ